MIFNGVFFLDFLVLCLWIIYTWASRNVFKPILSVLNWNFPIIFISFILIHFVNKHNTILILKRNDDAVKSLAVLSIDIVHVCGYNRKIVYTAYSELFKNAHEHWQNASMLLSILFIVLCCMYTVRYQVYEI